MILFENLYFEILFLSLALCWAGFWLVVIKNRSDMKSSAKSLKEINVIPAGSGLRHGMVINANKGIGVIRDSQPSDTWFRRLL